MKRPVLHHLVVFLIAAGTFFSVASFAQADTFSFPQSYHYTGLTFSQPLTYTKTPKISQPTTTISFSAQHKLLINKNDTLKPLEAIVLTPTASDVTPTSAATLNQPTPTIFAQPTTDESTTQNESISPTPTPTQEPTTTTAPTTAAYTPAPQSNPGGLNADDLFSMVNAYRASQGLPAFQQDAKTCSLAAQRAPAIAGEVASGNMHAGLIAMDLPYWNTENIISMNSDQAAFNWWINDPIHHAAIVSNNTYSCVACSGNSCAEEFTSYQPK
jgi:uncharacterized protein YkwD